MENFSFETIQDFDKHISESIPNYLLIHDMVLGLSDYFLEDDTNIFDLGCSKGTLLKKIAKNTSRDIKFYGIDKSENLLPKNENNLNFINRDITKNNFDMKNSSLILSIFTLQFLPKKDRLKVLKKIYNGLNKGGALIVCEKVYAENSQMQDIYTSLYYQFKEKNFSTEQILKKEKDLRPVMKLLSKSDNQELLKDAGFKLVDSFFQSYNFVGWICIK